MHWLVVSCHANTLKQNRINTTIRNNLEKGLNGLEGFLVGGRQDDVARPVHHESAHKVPLHVAQTSDRAESLVGGTGVLAVHISFGEDTSSLDAFGGTEGLHLGVAARLWERER